MIWSWGDEKFYDDDKRFCDSHDFMHKTSIALISKIYFIIVQTFFLPLVYNYLLSITLASKRYQLYISLRLEFLFAFNTFFYALTIPPHSWIVIKNVIISGKWIYRDFVFPCLTLIAQYVIVSTGRTNF